MAIDTSGEWWRGTDAGDIDGYVEALVNSNGGYVPSRFAQAICSSCGGAVFRVEADPDQYVRRTCVSCADVVEMLDSSDVPERTNAMCSPSSAPVATTDKNFPLGSLCGPGVT